MRGYTGNIYPGRGPKPPGERYEIAGVVLSIAEGAPDIFLDAEVWLETELEAFDGLCIASGADRRAALTAAAKVLQQLLKQVHELEAHT